MFPSNLLSNSKSLSSNSTMDDFKSSIGLGVTLLSLTLLASLSAHAFPELTRHGYVSCTACHVSPAGGGALTPYGRSMSREILSRWGQPGEEAVLHGLLHEATTRKMDEMGLRWGGNVRGVQTHRETSRVRQGKFFLMQADVEVGFESENWAGLLSAGEVENPRSDSPQRTFNSTEHWVMWKRSSETAQWGVRGGRFPLAFGGLQADHTLSVRKLLALGFSSARHSLEVSGADGNQMWNIGVTTPVDAAPADERENALALRLERVLSSEWRAGAGAWRGRLRDGSRSSLSFHALGSWKDILYKPYLQLETLHIQRWRDNSADVISHAALVRNGWELSRGFFGIVQLQHERGDTQLHSSEVNRYSMGVQVFPRPHFEVYALWHKVHRPFAKDDNWTDEAFAVLHYYL